MCYIACSFKLTGPEFGHILKKEPASAYCVPLTVHQVAGHGSLPAGDHNGVGWPDLWR